MTERTASIKTESTLPTSPEAALEKSRKDLEAKGYTFLERYSGKQKEAKGEIRDFDIYSVPTEKGFKLFALTSEPFELRLIEGKRVPISWTSRFAGRYEVSTIDSSNDPRNFLGISEDVNGFPTVMSDVYVEVTRYGLGSRLLDLLCEKLKEQNCVHIVAFSKAGDTFLSKPYTRHGYVFVPVIDEQKEGEIYQRGPFDLTDPARYVAWMYKCYRNAPVSS
jgi:hypothetical protein